MPVEEALRGIVGVCTLASMSDDPSKPDVPPSAPPPPSTAGKDLADGLELMLRAARKAVKKVDPSRIEQAGRRALHNLETLDARKVGELGKKAAKNLDPKHIEEVAEEAGRELLSVVERVADRMEAIVNKARGDEEESPRPPAAAAAAPEQGPDDEATKAAPTPEERPRVRIED